MSFPSKFRVPSGLSRLLLPGLAAAAVLAGVWGAIGRADETAAVVPAPAVDQPLAAGELQTAVLAGGCFWGVQGVFEHVKGVRQVLAGYSGGEKATAVYEVVSTGETGHAESIQIKFDPAEISYGEILRIFFSVAHDPTELNRQGPDEGTQYRSAIFYADAAQQRIAEAYIAQLDRRPHLRQPDRDPRRSPEGILPGRGLPSGFPDPQSRPIPTSSSTTCRRSPT